MDENDMKRRTMWINANGVMLYMGACFNRQISDVEIIVPSDYPFFHSVEFHASPRQSATIKRGTFARQRFNPTQQYNKSLLLSKRRVYFDRDKTLSYQISGIIGRSEVVYSISK